MSVGEITPERWVAIKRVLQAALELPEEDRTRYLDTACLDDTAMRSEVESLILAHHEASSFLANPVALPPSPAVTQLAVGQRLGAYQIVQVIGEGGMGTVYQALRDDIRKLVAIKLVKRGMHTEFVLDRFARERQILAHFDHPYITKFLDTGLANDGRPYFVMEFIAGRHIDTYCDAHALPTRDRLQLFLKVCAGVEYAHRNLVVHRDLKPRNILVTEDGDPKLLDFGIAKILEEDPLTGSSDATVTVVRMMTPEYASPEQARGEPVSTASDIYSLGVLLYELLTGHRPYRLKGRMPSDAAEVICHSDPPRPSIVVRRTEPADPATESEAVTPESVSATRDGRPAKLARALSGDLDNIVMKALQKKPEQRYGSVEHMADDIRRHLDGLPVLARDATLQYRAAKFVRRHTIGVATVALLVASLAGGLAATMRQARIARIQQARAERRFQDVRALANSLLFEVYDAIQNLPGSTPARELLVKRALLYLDGLSAESAGDAGLRRELAAAYEKVGDVQGGYRTANLGNAAGALASYRKALEIRESLAAPDVATRRDLVRTHGKLGDVLLGSGNATEAIEHSRKLLVIAEGLVAANPESPTDQANLAAAYLDAGWKQAGAGDWQTGLGNSRKSAVLFEHLVAAHPGEPATQRRLAIAYERTGDIIADNTNHYDEALEFHRKELALTERLAAAAPLDTSLQRLVAYAHLNIGTDLSSKGDPGAARPHFDQAAAEFERLASDDPKSVLFRFDIARAQGLIADAAIDTGDASRAIERLTSNLARLQELPATPERNTFLTVDQFRLGKAWLRLAESPQKAGAARRKAFSDARSWYQRSLPGLMDAEQHGNLHGHDRSMIAEARKAIEMCDAAMAARP